MTRALLGGLLLAGGACAPAATSLDAGTSRSDGGAAIEPTDAGEGDAGAPPRADGGVTVETLQRRAVEALCGALARCCDASSTVRFFAPMKQNTQLPADLRERLPADGGVSAAACVELLAQVFDVRPLGSWVRAVKEGLATFSAAGAQACLSELETAACGDAVADALHDGTCFGFGPPPGGAAQRRAFARSGSMGVACQAIADGVGGGFYGTCDPTVAFCCGPRSDGTCGVVGDRVGECRLAAQQGQQCGLAPSLVVCATGLECDPGSGQCVAPKTASLQVGAACAAGSTLLGECVDGWCDFGGDDTCKAWLPLGASCVAGWACASGECAAGKCASPTYCRGP